MKNLSKKNLTTLPATTQSRSSFVGRESELGQLHKILKVVISSQKPKFLLIKGDTGVGKTALIEYFLENVTALNSELLIGRGKCAMETEYNGLIPFKQLLQNLAERGMRQHILVSNLLDFAKEVAPAWLDVFTAGVAGATAKTIKESGKLMGYGTFSQENVFVQFTNALRRLSEKKTVIVFLDDLHWADTSTLSLLFHLAHNFQEQSVLFLCTYRPVEAMEIGPNAKLFRDVHANLIRYGAVEIDLSQGIDVSKYVAQRYPLNLFPPDLIRRVQELTEGYALFVNQVFSLLEDTGVIKPTLTSNGRLKWGIVEGADIKLSIRPTLDEVLEERLRLMEDDLRETLTYASVEGEDFTMQILVRLHQLGDENKVYKALEILDIRYRLVQEQESKEVDARVLDFYRFIHRFFREYIYSKLSKGRRRTLHQKVGECLETLYSDRLPIAGQLAHHFKEAHEMLKAARYALMAAQFEQLHYAWSEGKNWCEFGLVLTEKLPPNSELRQLQLDLLEQEGDCYWYSGKYNQADRQYQRALELARALQANPERIANLCDKIAEMYIDMAKCKEACLFAEQGKQILSDHRIAFGKTHFTLEVVHATAECHLGTPQVAIRRASQALADARNLPQTLELERSRARAYHCIAIALSELDRYVEVLDVNKKAIEIARKISDKQLEANYLLMRALMYYYMGEAEESMTFLAESLEIIQIVGDFDNESWAQSLKGQLSLMLERPRDAIRELTKSVALAESIGALWNMPSTYGTLALSYLALSDLEKAYKYATAGISLVNKANLKDFQAGCAFDALAQVEAARQDWKAATRHFNRAIVIHRQDGDRHFMALAQRHFAEALLKQGKLPNAVNLLETALVIFRELELLYEVAKTQKILETIKAKIN